MTFSIIIPVYNVAPYLRECLDSVLAQTYTDWEAICVDDGSKDGSGAILDEYAARDARFNVIHQANRGVSAARNVAMRHVRGTYVGFMDGDDSFSADWLQAVSRAIDLSPGVDWVRMGFRYLRDDGCVDEELTLDQVKCKQLSGDDLVRYGWSDVLPHGFPWLNFYRAELAKGRLFNSELRYQEDMYWTLELILQLRTAVVSNYNGYLYRQRDDSACYLPLKVEDAHNNISEFMRIWLSHGKRLLQIDKGDSIKRQISLISFRLIVERWGRLYADDHRKEANDVCGLVWRAYREKAFSPRFMPGKNNVLRWYVFVYTGWWGAFRPLRSFIRVG